MTESRPSGLHHQTTYRPMPTTASTSTRRVLVVEDMPALRSHLIETVQDLGPEVVVQGATDGNEAITAITSAPVPFDLVMSDIIMPGMDGEALLTELNRRRYPASVVMLTALGHDDMVMKCLRLGACDYLVKPAKMEDIQLSVANALQHHPLITDQVEVAYDPLGWFEIRAVNDRSALFKYRKFLGLLDRFRIPEPTASEVRLALDELGTNAIEWGNKNDRSKKVTFGCRILPGKIMVYIEDEGDGFTPEQVPDPSTDPLRHIEQRQASGKRMGGYGIHLIRNLMDKVIYNGKGNRVVAIKYLDRANLSGSRPAMTPVTL